MGWVFYQHGTMRAQHKAMAPLPVYLSVTNLYCIEMDENIELVFGEKLTTAYTTASVGDIRITSVRTPLFRLVVVQQIEPMECG